MKKALLLCCLPLFMAFQFNLSSTSELLVRTWVIDDYQLPGTTAEMQKIMDALVDEMRGNTYLKFTKLMTYEFYSDGEMDRGTYELSNDSKKIRLTNAIRVRVFEIENISRKQLTVKYKDPSRQTIRMVFVPAPDQQ